MNNKTCRYCGLRLASSKEHLIADSRLTRIKSFRYPDQANDNVRKTFKGITCEPCNRELGKYEEKRWSSLAYATVWKILAGNLNLSFSDLSHKLSNSDMLCISSFEELLRLVIKGGNRVLPSLTFSFDFDPNSLKSDHNHTVAVQKIQISFKDEAGNPIQGATFYAKDKKGTSPNSAYLGISDAGGMAESKVLIALESVCVVAEEVCIENTDNGEKIFKLIDVIIYISFDMNRHRLVLILPLIGDLQTPWPNCNLRVSHKGFIPILQKHIKDIRIIDITSYFLGEFGG